jgi:hypothetical protein
MTIRRDNDAVLLEGVCAVEDSELLLQELQAGAALIDWSGCTHLHAACLQVILVARLPLRGTPANPALAHWLGPILHPGPAPLRPLPAPEPETEPEPAWRMEA